MGGAATRMSKEGFGQRIERTPQGRRRFLIARTVLAVGRIATFSAHTASPPPPSRTPAGSLPGIVEEFLSQRKNLLRRAQHTRPGLGQRQCASSQLEQFSTVSASRTPPAITPHHT